MNIRKVMSLQEEGIIVGEGCKGGSSYGGSIYSTELFLQLHCGYRRDNGLARYIYVPVKFQMCIILQKVN